MGAGIGLGFLRSGAAVTFLARDEARARLRLADAVGRLHAVLREGCPSDAQLDVVTSVEELPICHLVIESIAEDAEAKRELLRELSAAQPHALLGTNTSSLPISELASAVLDPGRFAGTHFWYPPPLMPLVELVPGTETTTDAMDRWATALGAAGWLPVRLRRDVPGFLWNRLQVAVLREAKHLVESGVADARTVDLVVELGLARRWSVTGPLATAALGGITTFETVGRNLLPQLSDAADLAGLATVLAGYVDDADALDRRRNQELSASPVVRVEDGRHGS